MESWNSGLVSISHSSLAIICGASRQQVQACIVKLRGLQLIEPDGPPIKQVQPYRILHARAIPTGAATTAEPANPGSIHVQSRVKPAVLCPTCRQMRYGLLRAGYCRSCNWKRNVRAVVREELAATA
jgi:hypothetical protein